MLTGGVAAQRGIIIPSMNFTVNGELDIRGFFGVKGIYPWYERIGDSSSQADTNRENLETMLTP